MTEVNLARLDDLRRYDLVERGNKMFMRQRQDGRYLSATELEESLSQWYGELKQDHQVIYFYLPEDITIPTSISEKPMFRIGMQYGAISFIRNFLKSE